MLSQRVVRAAYYLRVSTESQELEILPFIDRRGWKLVHTYEDVMSGQKREKDRCFGPADQGGYKSNA